jgi:alpha-glucosidase (family GH31 glycosyl hydrolase)
MFIRNCQQNIFIGDCWPGKSSWIDFLNQDAQNYWSTLYGYDKFNGTTQDYYAWNDMNEPSVFNAEELTLPKNSYHRMSDGTSVKHRDVHNVYGALQQRATLKGLLDRDSNERRAFVLTRSFFVGSQKFGTYWSGANTSTFGEL